MKYKIRKEVGEAAPFDPEKIKHWGNWSWPAEIPSIDKVMDKMDVDRHKLLRGTVGYVGKLSDYPSNMPSVSIFGGVVIPSDPIPDEFDPREGLLAYYSQPGFVDRPDRNGRMYKADAVKEALAKHIAMHPKLDSFGDPIYKTEAFNPAYTGGFGMDSIINTQNNSMGKSQLDLLAIHNKLFGTVWPGATVEQRARRWVRFHRPATPRLEREFLKVITKTLTNIEDVCKTSQNGYRLYLVGNQLVLRAHSYDADGNLVRYKTFEYSPEPERAVGHQLNLWLTPLQRIIHSLAVGNNRYAMNRMVLLENSRRHGKMMVRASYRRYMDYVEDTPKPWWPIIQGGKVSIKHFNIGNQDVE